MEIIGKTVIDDNGKAVGTVVGQDQSGRPLIVGLDGRVLNVEPMDRAEKMISEEIIKLMRESTFECAVCKQRVPRIERYASDTNRSMGIRFCCHGDTDDYEISTAMLSQPRRLLKIRPFSRAAAAIQVERELRRENTAPQPSAVRRAVAEYQWGVQVGETVEFVQEFVSDLSRIGKTADPDPPRIPVRKAIILPPPTERKITLGED